MPQRKKAILRPDNTAEFTCPKCGTVNLVKSRVAVRSSTPVRTRIRCGCGASHAVFLERRAFVRKSVELAGTYRRLREDMDHPMTVRNLSRTGLLFEMSDGDGLQVGDRLRVDFSFGNKTITRIFKEASVRRVDGTTVGAEFTAGAKGDPLDPRYDLALAQYDPRAGVQT